MCGSTTEAMRKILSSLVAVNHKCNAAGNDEWIVHPCSTVLRRQAHLPLLYGPPLTCTFSRPISFWLFSVGIS